MATLLFFGKIGANIFGGESAADAFAIDFLSDTIKCSLHTAITSFAVDTDEVFADILDEVAGGNGYTAAGATLGTKTAAYNATGNVTTFDCADPSWAASGAGFSARAAVFYKDTGVASTSPLIGYIDHGSTITLASGDTLTINIDAAGLYTVTAPGT